MTRVLLDTNAYSALALGDEAVLDAISEADVVYMSMVVLGELTPDSKAVHASWRIVMPFIDCSNGPPFGRCL